MLKYSSINKKKIPSIKLYFFINALMLAPCVAYADNDQLAAVEFDSAFLDPSSRASIDLSRFRRSGQLTPGLYPLDIYKNGEWVGRENVDIVDENGASKICLTPSIVSSLDINWSVLGKSEQELATDKKGCIDVFSEVPDFKATLSSSDLSVSFSIPQLYINKNSAGYISPENWSSGINAGYVNYRLDGYRSKNKNTSAYSSYFGSVNTGVNVGQWRFRHNGTYSKASEGKGGYQSQSTYVQRDIIPWLSRITLGEYYSQGHVFDSIAYLGAEIRSDDRMLPESLTGFAPVITGVADSTARVTIYQNNQQIYETTVSPGPFSINDLYNTGYNGDLNVVITEADGREKRFTVAYSNIVQLLRPGMSKYSIVAGRYRNSSYTEKPTFLEGTYQRGISNLMTAYTGLRVSENYKAGVLGMAFNTPLGAIAGDVTLSRASNLPVSWLNGGGSSSGQSYRITLNKLITETKTNLVLGAYRYSSKGYLGFDDFVRAKNAYALGEGNQNFYNFGSVYPQRDRFQIYLSQQISDFGSVYISGLTESYWDSNKKRTSNYQLGYTHSFKNGLSALLSYSYYKNSTSPNQVSMSLSIPLELGNLNRMGVSATRDKNNNSSLSTNVSGYLGDEKRAFYGLYADMHSGNGNDSRNVGGNLQFDAKYADLYAGASTNNSGSSQINASISGSFLIHGGGVNFSKQLGDTFGVIHAPGAAGARINSDPRNTIAGNDYGVVTQLNSYRKNTVWLDSEGTADDVEITGSAIYVAPTQGAIVPLQFKTKMGRAVLLQVVNERNERPPLGAQVVDVANGSAISMVGQGGYIYFRGIESAADFKIEWDVLNNKACYFSFKPSENEDAQRNYSPYDQQKITCTIR